MKQILHLVSVKNVTFKSSYNLLKIDIRWQLTAIFSHFHHLNYQCIQIIEFLCAQCSRCKASVFVTFLVTLWD